MAIMSTSLSACGNDEPESEIPGGDNTEVPENGKILVAYFSWGGTTRRMATQISELTGGKQQQCGRMAEEYQDIE